MAELDFLNLATAIGSLGPGVQIQYEHFRHRSSEADPECSDVSCHASCAGPLQATFPAVEYVGGWTG
jgi:hypothetical protein